MGPSEAVGGKNLPELWDVDEQDGSLKDEKILAAIDFINSFKNVQSYPDLIKMTVKLIENTQLSEEVKRKIAQVKPSVLRDVFPHLYQSAEEPTKSKNNPIIEDLKIRASNPEGAKDVAMNIQSFEITSEEDRLEIALACANFAGGMISVAKNIEKFEIRSERARINLVNLLIQNPYGFRSILEYIHKFKITEEKFRIDLAYAFVAVPYYAELIPLRIQNFEISSDDVRLAIAKSCAQIPRGAEAIAQAIKCFKFNNERTRVEVAKMCTATSLGACGVASNFREFEVSNEKDCIEILVACLVHPEVREFTAKKIDEFSISNKVILSLVKSIDPKGLLNPDKRYVFLKSNICEKGIRLEATFKILNDKHVRSNPTLQKELLDQITLALVLYEAAKPEVQEWIKKWGLLDKALSLRNGPLRDAFLEKTFRLAKDPELQKAFDSLSKTSVTGKSGRAKVQAVSHEFYLKNLTLVLLKPEITDEVLRKYAVRLNIAGMKEDHLKMNRLLETLSLLVDHKEEVGDAMPTVLERLVPEKSKDKEVVERSNALVGLLQFGAASYLRDETTGSFIDLTIKRLKEMVSIGEVVDFQPKYEATLARFREFPLIGAYAGKLNSLPEREALLGHYGRFLRATLNGNFKETRESIKNNPHLERLQRDHPEILKAWHAGRPSIGVEALLGDKTALKVPSKMDYSAQLKEKLVFHGHLEKDKIPDLIAYFNDLAKMDGIRQSLPQKGDDPYAKLQLICLDLIEVEDEKSVLEDLYKHLQTMGTEVENFKNDIKGFLDLLAKSAIRKENPYKGLQLVFTDDPNDYLLSGTEVAGSCQSITAGADTNMCLLSYLLDGKNRLITIKDPTGKIVTRSVIRLMLDETNKQPVLFQEGAYSSVNDPQLKGLLYSQAKAWASELNIPYASPQERHQAPLASLGGPVPYEYSDAAGGIQPKGRYTI